MTASPHALALSLIVSADLVDKLCWFGLLILALAIHEFGHAWTALKLGDDTAQRLGRVTLNPLPHLDPMFSVFLPLAMLLSNSPILFGAGRPVPVDDRNFRHRALDLMLVSAAGPFMNIVLAFVLIGFYHVSVWILGAPAYEYREQPAYKLLMAGIELNFVLAIFNMIPVPPLDGHRVLAFFLPAPLRERYYRMQMLGMLVLLLLLFTGMIGTVLSGVLVPIGRLLVPLMPDQIQLFAGRL